MGLLLGKVASVLERSSLERDILEAVRDSALKFFDLGFESGRDPTGAPWKPNSATTRKTTTKILVESGKLRRLEHFIRGRSVHVGARKSLPYHRVLQKGGTTPTGGRIPPRVYVAGTEALASHLSAIVDRRYGEATRRL